MACFLYAPTVLCHDSQSHKDMSNSSTGYLSNGSCFILLGVIYIFAPRFAALRKRADEVKACRRGSRVGVALPGWLGNLPGRAAASLGRPGAAPPARLCRHPGSVASPSQFPKPLPPAQAAETERQELIKANWQDGRVLMGPLAAFGLVLPYQGDWQAGHGRQAGWQACWPAGRSQASCQVGLPASRLAVSRKMLRVLTGILSL